MQATQIKMRAGGYRHQVTEVQSGDRLYFKFGYSKALMAEIKALEGARWEGPIGENPPKCPPDVAAALGGTKAWSVPISQHNLFQLDYLKGGDPYKWYDRPLVEYEINARPNGLSPMSHQKELTNFFLTARHCVASAEQGVGKTLAVICAVEILKPAGDVWWVSSGSGVAAVRAELKKWGANFTPKLMTYNEMLKRVKQHQEGAPISIPQVLVLDEAHKVKTHTSQRSQAAAFLADAIRETYGKDNSLIILMTGTPAPNNPSDWWHLCRVACPGFLREGTWEKFRHRLGVIVARENVTTGGMFPQLVSWKDRDDLCEVCGKAKDVHDIHQTPEDVLTAHPFQPCVNEVAKLYKRMTGLVIRKFKKDCLDLPDIQYRQIICKPTADMLRTARLIAARTRRKIETITLLRELSDGFQYQEVKGEEIKCPDCKDGKITDFVEIGEEEFEEREVDCYVCNGTGTTNRITRIAKYIPTPKEAALRQQLELHEDCGRLVTYAGFTGSIDRIVDIAKSEKWATIKWDGRGIVCRDHTGMIIKSDPLVMFQEQLDEYPRVCFIGHPESAGEGITLTRSPSIVFYSNDFNFKSRDQAEARIHRIGMDINRGATIIDLICLETDLMILNNLKNKKRLQTMSLTGLTFEDRTDRLYDIE